MTATVQQATRLFERLDEQDQLFAIDFLARLEEKKSLKESLITQNTWLSFSGQ